MGEQFGEYELRCQIGSGGMANIWAARRPTETGLVNCAIKLIRSDSAEDPGLRELFLREGKLAMRMSHGNLIGVSDVGEHDGRLYMVMDLVDGVSLDRFLDRVRSWHPDRPNLDEAVFITRELLRALHYVHTDAINEVNQRVVHRDVSPQNVMVTSAGEIKLADFGVARVMDGHGTDRVCGKLAYMPREQYQGNPVQQSDLFAVGAILYEMLTGHWLRPQTPSRAALHEAIMNGGVPELPPGLPPEVREVLAGLLEPEPTRRIQSAKAALRLLGNWLSRGDIGLDIEELYLDCVDSRHSWYTDLTAQAQVETQRDLRREQAGEPEGEEMSASGSAAESALVLASSSVSALASKSALASDSMPALASDSVKPAKNDEDARVPDEEEKGIWADAEGTKEGTQTPEDAQHGKPTSLPAKKAKPARRKPRKVRRAKEKAKKHRGTRGKQNKPAPRVSGRIAVDTEAPLLGRPWERAQGHEAALDEAAIDEVTTMIWSAPLGSKPGREVQP
ncbi:MAG: serine/threonine-protein kinase [Myxococcota bacterium]